MRVIEDIKKRQAKTAASIKEIRGEMEKLWKAIDALKKLSESTQNFVETMQSTVQQLLDENEEMGARIYKIENKGKLRIRVSHGKKKGQ